MREHHSGGSPVGPGVPPFVAFGASPGPRGAWSLRRCRIARTAQMIPPAAAAPISAQAHPGRPFDSEDFEPFLVAAAAAAPATAAAGAWLVEVVVVVFEGAVVVSVLMT